MIEVKLVEEKKQEVTFPCLMKASDGKFDSLVVLMTGLDGEDMGIGTVVKSGVGVHEVGYYSNTWVFENFKPLQGKLILKNK